LAGYELEDISKSAEPTFAENKKGRKYKKNTVCF